MAWKGPSGLLGEPETDRENFGSFPVKGHPALRAYIHREIFDHLASLRATAEGDYLFFVEGFGRLRFRIVEECDEGGSRPPEGAPQGSGDEPEAPPGGAASRRRE